jgi:hypothetical protein
MLNQNAFSNFGHETRKWKENVHFYVNVARNRVGNQHLRFQKNNKFDKEVTMLIGIPLAWDSVAPLVDLA